MGHKNYMTSIQKQDIVMLLSDGNATLEIAKRLNSDHKTIKRKLKTLAR